MFRCHQIRPYGCRQKGNKDADLADFALNKNDATVWNF